MAAVVVVGADGPNIARGDGSHCIEGVEISPDIWTVDNVPLGTIPVLDERAVVGVTHGPDIPRGDGCHAVQIVGSSADILAANNAPRPAGQ